MPYPDELDDFTNPTVGQSRSAAGVEEWVLFSQLNDAVEAIETELGLNPAGGYDTLEERLSSVNGLVVSDRAPIVDQYPQFELTVTGASSGTFTLRFYPPGEDSWDFGPIAYNEDAGDLSVAIVNALFDHGHNVGLSDSGGPLNTSTYIFTIQEYLAWEIEVNENNTDGDISLYLPQPGPDTSAVGTLWLDNVTPALYIQTSTADPKDQWKLVIDWSASSGGAGGSGALGIWEFDSTSATNADPGAGKIRFDNANLNSGTAFSMSMTDTTQGGNLNNAIQTILFFFAPSINPDGPVMRFQSVDDPTKVIYISPFIQYTTATVEYMYVQGFENRYLTSWVPADGDLIAVSVFPTPLHPNPRYAEVVSANMVGITYDLSLQGAGIIVDTTDGGTMIIRLPNLNDSLTDFDARAGQVMFVKKLGSDLVVVEVVDDGMPIEGSDQYALFNNNQTAVFISSYDRVGDLSWYVMSDAARPLYTLMSDIYFSASTPDTVIAKVEVFDAAGSQIGWIPVYNDIS